MGTLQILPWCALSKTYRLGEITLIRVRADDAIEGADAESAKLIRRFLASYRSIDGTVVDPCTVVAYRGDDPTRDLTTAELDEAAEAIQLATFSSLAARRFFREPYSNSTCFTRIVQSFKGTEGIAVYSRRRDGGTLDARVLPATVFGIPSQAATVHDVIIDENLFVALTRYRDNARPSDWVRWQNAIDCFNFANTDDASIPLHVEWVMAAAAFQRLTGTRSDADGIASAFEDAIQPEASVLAGAARVRRFSEHAAMRTLRFVWAREFYALRGEYAHGRITTNREHTWEPFEHLLLAAIAFPLLIKSLLAAAGMYELTDHDWAQIDAFEALLDSNFLTRPADWRNSWDTIWSRLESDHYGRRRLRNIINEVFRSVHGEPDGD